MPPSVGLHVEVEGTPRNLHPIVRDEIYRVASEALRNAVRHAEAQRIEVEFRYDQRQFRLRVRDDGKGIDATFLTAEGRTGHFGLHGMREAREAHGRQADRLDCGGNRYGDRAHPSGGPRLRPHLHAVRGWLRSSSGKGAQSKS